MFFQGKHERKQCFFTIQMKNFFYSLPKELHVNTHTHAFSHTHTQLQEIFFKWNFTWKNKRYQNVVKEKFWLNPNLETRLPPREAFSCHASCSSPPFFSSRPWATWCVIVVTCNCPHSGSGEQDVKIISSNDTKVHNNLQFLPLWFWKEVYLINVMNFDHIDTLGNETI